MMTRYHLVSGIPKPLAPLPRSPAPPCTPCVEGRQRTAPHSSSFPPTTAPFQTLHSDIWGPSPVLGPRQECYFLIMVDNYSCYTTVFPLRQKAESWLLARGGAQGLCRICLHSDHGASSVTVSSAASSRVTPWLPVRSQFPPRSSLRPVAAEPGGVPVD
ncbi:unnamed protein product [Closterium sp. NIES-54]